MATLYFLKCMTMPTRVAPARQEYGFMRNRAYRRHQTYRHMWRRLKEDRNQHYDDLRCPCWSDPAAMARFKEQPKVCSNPICCGNPRRSVGSRKERLTMAERRFMCE